MSLPLMSSAIHAILLVKERYFEFRENCNHLEETMKRILIFIIMLWSLAPFEGAAQTFNIDPSHTTIEFKVRNMLITNVRGTFEKFKGTVFIDETDLGKSKVDVSIETASINTGINRRDNHLRSADFFDVVKFPVMTFVSTGIEPGIDRLKVTGNLTI
ncbi:MAG: polyisoprenoid-binding protein, partial [Geobacter sp.]